MIAMRGKDAGKAGHPSSMARASGYLAVVPFPGSIGWPSVDAGSWTPVCGFLVIQATGVVVAGALAGRPDEVNAVFYCLTESRLLCYSAHL